jgi:ketosteroid isomerase-like protein
MTGSTIDAYVAAWNAHDGAAVAARFAADGRFEAPGEAPAVGAAIAGQVERLVAAFPDLRFTVRARTEAGSRAVVEWVLHGRNDGPPRAGIEPTGRTIALDGVDVCELGEGGLVRVRRHFDRTALAEALGLMTLVQPAQQGPASFGYSMRVPSGNPRVPGVIALTWIRGRDDAEREKIRGHSRRIVQDFLAEPGFIGIVTGFAGDRGFTVTAWEDEAALHRALGHQHAAAMRELRSTDLSPGVWTSVWQPLRVNRVWTRCPGCAALADASADPRACSRCGGPLPPRPSLW